MSESVKQDTTTAPAAEQQGPCTFTQDEVNSIVAENLSKEREKYADYENLKAKADQFDQIMHENAVRDMRSRIAEKYKVSADLLTFETEEECSKQADSIAKALKAEKPGYPVVRDGGELPLYKLGWMTPNASAAFDRDKKHTPKDPTRW